MLKKLLPAIFLIVQTGFAQTDFFSEFKEMVQTNDSVSMKKLLKKWEKEKPGDPELFTSYFNYYYLISRNETMVLSGDKIPDDEIIMVLQDSLGNTAGYMGSKTFYNDTLFNKGIAYIDKGIQLYPNRLDMRFGKVYVYGQRKKWDDFTRELIKAIDYSAKNNNQWTWTLNEPLETPKEFFLGNIQNYINDLFYTGDDKLLENIKQISERVLKYYPNHVESLTNIGVMFLIQENLDESLKYFQKAEKLAPEDAIVLGNIAQVYQLKDMKEKAIEYYEKVLKYGDEDSKSFAREQLEALKK